MGMFDTITCEMPLPEPKPPDGLWWQTKDFECEMARYTITEDGRLIYHSFHYESTPQEKLPYPDAEPGSFKSICGILTVVSDGDVEMPHHGDVRFYSSDDHGGWWEYLARFTEGRCVRIDLVGE